MGYISLSDYSSQLPIGGKARSLVKLIASGFTVPEGFVILSDEELNQIELLEAFENLNSTYVAVRSSALAEDGEKAAWAGQLETKLHVKQEGLIDAINACRESGKSERAQAYAQAREQESGEVAVIVQRMLESDISGVSFSRHPVTGEEAVVIEAVRGQGEQLVSGSVTPDTYVVVEPFEISEQHLSTGQALLGMPRLKEVSALTHSIAQDFGFPVDVEWAYEAGVLYVLQARPITML